MNFSDIRGIAHLATQATSGVTRIVEEVHQSVWGTMGFPDGHTAGKARGITGLVYRTINGSTELAGQSTDKLLSGLQALFDSDDQADTESPRREAYMSALNGVIGDHLEQGNSPFSIPMAFRYERARQGSSSKILLLIHGLCMSDLQSHALRNDYAAEPGEALASALDYTPVYLRYNSGLPIAQNGPELSALMEQLVTRWPGEIEDLAVVAHSMGGLLIRSAVNHAEQEGLRWPQQLGSVVFLGTPHQGAPLEKVGSWLDTALDALPYTKPFSSLTRIRSAGITDLRHGNPHTPLPDSVNCYTIAATLAEKRSTLADHLVGDGMVPLRSALGRHKDATKTLSFAKTSQHIMYNMNHMKLINSPEVNRQIVHWLAPTETVSKPDP
jgi:hypothetical protein